MTKNIPDYIGRFKVKKELTKLLNYGDWVIYRDPENGIYLFNTEIEQEVNPMLWNITKEGWDDHLRNMLISDIEDFMEEYNSRNPNFDNYVPDVIRIRVK